MKDLPPRLPTTNHASVTGFLGGLSRPVNSVNICLSLMVVGRAKTHFKNENQFLHDLVSLNQGWKRSGSLQASIMDIERSARVICVNPPTGQDDFNNNAVTKNQKE